ncbi:MAG: HD domain-containing protein [Lachnospiraceae bacterium]|nr:HD domain-containing protein [Lachnospiraceae bacterium]
MAEKLIKDIVGNEILGRPILSSNYQVILPAGAVIRPEYVDKLAELGIHSVYIKDEEPDTEERDILKAEVKKQMTDKVKAVMERHTYHRNDELATLSVEADVIIDTILDEEQVMERVFDIKEKSTDVYEHSLTVCTMAIVMALKLQLKKTVVHDIGVGCLLHDIGLRYLTISYENQNIESLSQADQAEYKKHAVYGYSALKDENWMADVSKKIILCHHERLDGTGYPLHQTDIPLEIDIVNVCDTFDEMISGIGYSRTKVYQALQYLKENRGIKFRADVVDLLLQFVAAYPAGTLVKTNKGETAIVISQNKINPDRPAIRILSDRYGKAIVQDTTIDLAKQPDVFIESVLD